jgi:hypothetical protein
MDYKLAAKILYKYFYGNIKVGNYRELVSTLISYLQNVPYTNHFESTKFKVNFEYFKIPSSFSNSIKSILMIDKHAHLLNQYKVDNLIPEMFIFDDGEIHFNMNIFNSKQHLSIYTYKLLDDIKVKPGLNNASIFIKNEKQQFDKLIINNEFLHCGYGSERVRIFPGDWLINFSKNVLL